MLLQLKSDFQAIFPQSQWDKISTLIPLFTQTERTQLRKFLGSELLHQLNIDYRQYQTEGIQSALLSLDEAPVSEAFASATTSSDSLTLPILSASQRYIAYLTFANNVRTFSSSFNRGGGVNRAYSDSYDTLDEKDFQALSKELFMSAQDALEELLILLEQDAATTQTYTSLWKKNERYFYHHAALLFPTALALNPYYDINERREKFQTLVPHIESAQRRYLLPNLGKSLYEAFLAQANQVFASTQSSTLNPQSSTLNPQSSTPVSEASASASSILTSALPDLLHSLSYYLRADLATNDKYNQPSKTYLLHAEQHRNLALRIICDEPVIMKDFIVGTPLDAVYADLHNGTSLSQELAQQQQASVPEESVSACSCPNSRKSLSQDSFILDLT